jgi:hypothetical protein
MNCGLCVAYLRAENKCPGCFSGRKVNGKPIKCARRLCKKRRGRFCFDCEEFPCNSIKKLDERYRLRYGMSEIENLNYIKEHGIEKFLSQQKEKYVSEKGTFCVHDQKIYSK